MSDSDALTAPRVPWWRRFSKIDRHALVLIAVLKVVCLTAAGWRYVSTVGPTPLSAAFPDMWIRWDALHYYQLAWRGYHPADKLSVFFPLLPWLVRLASATGLSFRWSFFWIGNVTSFFGLYAFYRLARWEFGEARAFLALTFLATFPTHYFFCAPYTEGLLLLCLCTAWRSARRGRWCLAGLWAGLAAITRINGVLSFPALALEFAVQRRREKLPLRRALWLAVIPLAFGLFLLINWRVNGDPFFFMKESAFYQKHFAWPWIGLRSAWRRAAGVGFRWDNPELWTWELAASAFLLAASIGAWSRLPASYALYLSVATFVYLSTDVLVSTPRYILSAFPVFLLAGTVKPRFVYVPLFVLTYIAGLHLAGLFVQHRWAW